MKLKTRKEQVNEIPEENVIEIAENGKESVEMKPKKVKLKKPMNSEIEQLRKKEMIDCLKELNDCDPTTPEYYEILSRLEQLKKLKRESKVDPNTVIKIGAYVAIVGAITLIELPGNLVNLRAMKIADPIIKLLKI